MANIEKIPLKLISKVTTELYIQGSREIPDIAVYGINEATPFCAQEIGKRCVEHMLILYLSTSYHLMAYSVVAAGSESKCSYSVSEIIRCALLCNASQILLAHNHPSGNLEPSNDDLQATKKIAQAAQLFNINLIDSIIISPDGRSYSIRGALHIEE